MARVTAVINQKGGVGKSTTVHALCSGLKLKGYSTLTVDCDPQCNLSDTMQADTAGKGTHEALNGTPITELIQHTPHGDIIPSSAELAGSDREFVDVGREYLLSIALEPILNNYSHIILDCPPSLTILSVNALCACTDALIPMTADMYSLQGLSQLFTTINKVRQFCRKDVHIAGLLMCRHNSRSILSRDFMEMLESKATELGTSLFKTVIRESVSIREAQAQRESIFAYAADSRPAADYESFIKEYLEQET